MLSFPLTAEQPLPERASVLGLGRTGVATACFLAESGVNVVASDSAASLSPDRIEALDAAGVSWTLGTNDVRDGDTVVISPGIRPSSPVFRAAVERGAEVISEPELFARRFGRPILAITGTDGKSTVTTWLGHLLETGGVRTVVGGNLGNPLIADVDRADVDVAVLEISAFQLVTTHTLVPAMAAVTNIADDHLDHFDGDRDAYRASKRRLFDLCEPGCAVVRSADDPVVASWPIPSGADDLAIGLSGSSDLTGGLESGVLWLRDGETRVELVSQGELGPLGFHNVKNALMAAVMAHRWGVGVDAIREGLRSYRTLPHRCEAVETVSGVRFVNDSKATTPHATMAALAGMGGDIVLIAGGSDKGASFSELGKAIAERARAVVVMGETADLLREAIPAGSEIHSAVDLPEAVTRAFELAQPGWTVLLSPGCASFDQFSSFEERGEVFKQLVSKLR